MEIERVSLSIEKGLLGRFDAVRRRSGSANRSEAMRDLIRRRLVEEEWERGARTAVATLTLVYDHGKRDLSDRLVKEGHRHRARVLATLHVHLDEDRCLEILALQGRPVELRRLADHLLGLKGVEHGQLVMTSAGVGGGGRRR